MQLRAGNIKVKFCSVCSSYKDILNWEAWIVSRKFSGLRVGKLGRIFWRGGGDAVNILLGTCSAKYILGHTNCGANVRIRWGETCQLQNTR